MKSKVTLTLLRRVLPRRLLPALAQCGSVAVNGLHQRRDHDVPNRWLNVISEARSEWLIRLELEVIVQSPRDQEIDRFEALDLTFANCDGRDAKFPPPSPKLALRFADCGPRAECSGRALSPEAEY
ncbi:hypothetical protein EVAR_52874_1 [Eumeta japonica]|uniref:Uncharacterized protein n=1 Tax=Eumeta variegata TaxID=151549 RepID=A0A4C1YM28_EUMVA|nr:hypothetical protein EVAR_52874_1 [Eumeta japonica]